MGRPAAAYGRCSRGRRSSEHGGAGGKVDVRVGTSLQSEGTLDGGGATASASVEHRRAELRRRRSQGCDRPQQSGAVAAGNEPTPGGGAAAEESTEHQRAE